MKICLQGQPSGEAFIQMDSELSACETAQQKHHRYMIFGKKQRYIEVFQCSGEDMSLVLTGGVPGPSSPAKAAPALLSPGMLPSIAPLPPTNIPPPPPPAQISQNMVSNVSPLNWENPALLAQQQAQIIAQHNLIARQNQAQAQNEMLIMNQIAHHNLAVLNQNVGPVSPNNSVGLQQFKAPPGMPMMPHHLIQQSPFMVLPPRMSHLGLPRPSIAYPPHLIHGGGAGVFPVMPHVAMKRSYGDAFNEQASPAKRAFHAQGTLPVYQQFYPNM